MVKILTVHHPNGLTIFLPIGFFTKNMCFVQNLAVANILISHPKKTTAMANTTQQNRQSCLWLSLYSKFTVLRLVGYLVALQYNIVLQISKCYFLYIFFSFRTFCKGKFVI
jgi:hypothetical protein